MGDTEDRRCRTLHHLIYGWEAWTPDPAAKLSSVVLYFPPVGPLSFSLFQSSTPITLGITAHQILRLFPGFKPRRPTSTRKLAFTRACSNGGHALLWFFDHSPPRPMGLQHQSSFCFPDNLVRSWTPSRDKLHSYFLFIFWSPRGRDLTDLLGIKSRFIHFQGLSFSEGQIDPARDLRTLTPIYQVPLCLCRSSWHLPSCSQWS